MSKVPLLVLAAGGTGGHMFPAQALAEEMLGRGWRVKLSTDSRGVRFTQGFPSEVQIDVSASATFAHGGVFAKFSTPFVLAIGILITLFKMLQDRPSVVVGFGGYPSIPALSSAILLGLPRMIHEQNAVLGKVNQVFASRVQKVACGFWLTKLPRGASGIHVGNPVRKSVREYAATSYIPPGKFPMSVLVFGGSQGARIMSDVVPPALAQLPLAILNSLNISHQARPEDAKRVKKYYLENSMYAEVSPFFSDLPQRMGKAQLVISRAGASSLADITVVGRPSILVPLAIAVRGEQYANAQSLVDCQGAIMVEENNFNVEHLGQILKKFFAESRAALEMAKNAKLKGIPDSTERLAKEVLILNEKS